MAVTKSFSVEFDDALLDLDGWKNPRYEGSKLTGQKINEWNAGDITYGKNPVIENKTTALFIGASILGEGESADIVDFAHHSYISINKILIINPNTDTVQIINRADTNEIAFSRLISDNFPMGTKAHIDLLDPSVPHHLKNNHFIKFNRGFLTKLISYQKSGSDNAYNDLVFFGKISGSYSGSSNSGGPNGHGAPIFNYGGRSGAQGTPVTRIYSSSLEDGTYITNLSINDQNPLYNLIYPDPKRRGVANHNINNGQQQMINTNMTRLATFYNSNLFPTALANDIHIFVTMGGGTLDYHYNKGDTTIKSLNTAELDLDNYNPLTYNNSMRDNEDPDELTNLPFSLITPSHWLVPLKPNNIQESPFGLNTDISASFPGNTIITANVYDMVADNFVNANYGVEKYTDFESGSSQYIMSTLDSGNNNSLIVNLSKEVELPHGVGEKGFVISAEQTDRRVRDNIDYYLEKAGLIEKTVKSKAPRRGI